MGLSEGKRKTRLVGSAVTKNSAWTNDASLPGQRLLSSMGWSQGQGLGTSSQGSAVPITMAFKMDNKGIGARRFEKEARANGVADAWVGGAGQLGDLFERLNKASGSDPAPAVQDNGDASSKKRKSSKVEVSNEEVKKEKQSRKSKDREGADEVKLEEAVEKVASALPHRMAHRARFLKAKRMVGTDLASVNEILGIASPVETSSPAPMDTVVATSVKAENLPTASNVDGTEKDEKSKKKRKRDEEGGRKDKGARREARQLAKDAKKVEKEKRKGLASTKTTAASELEAKQNADTSTDPSFAAGGGMKVSTLSVHEYLQNQLMKRKAALVRRKRDEDASLWTRAATVCT